MRRCLFVSQRIGMGFSGATVASERNLHHCRQLFGEERLEVYKIVKGRVPSLIRKFLQSFGFVDGLLPRDIIAIKRRVRDGRIDLVFLDSSYFGLVAAALFRMKSATTIVIFYHDILVDWWRTAGQGSRLRKWFWARVYRRVERLSTRSADIRIFLTERDRNLATVEYGIDGGAIVTVSVADLFDLRQSAESYASRDRSVRVLLFVGTDYKPNVDGVSWFVARILPHIRSRLRVVGRGMENYRRAWSSDRTEIVGAVENLPQEYRCADAVVLPLLEGSGMKIKTVEALMFGKRVFGTPEAFVGFDLDMPSVGSLCDSEKCFISTIKAWEDGPPDPDGVNRASRAAFVSRYSYDATLSAMADALGMN